MLKHKRESIRYYCWKENQFQEENVVFFYNNRPQRYFFLSPWRRRGLGVCNFQWRSCQFHITAFCYQACTQTNDMPKTLGHREKIRWCLKKVSYLKYFNLCWKKVLKSGHFGQSSIKKKKSVCARLKLGCTALILIVGLSNWVSMSTHTHAECIYTAYNHKWLCSTRIVFTSFSMPQESLADWFSWNSKRKKKKHKKTNHSNKLLKTILKPMKGWRDALIFAAHNLSQQMSAYTELNYHHKGLTTSSSGQIRFLHMWLSLIIRSLTIPFLYKPYYKIRL